MFACVRPPKVQPAPSLSIQRSEKSPRGKAPRGVSFLAHRSRDSPDESGGAVVSNQRRTCRSSSGLSLVMLFWMASPAPRQRSMTCRDVTPNSRANSLTLIPFLATHRDYRRTPMPHNRSRRLTPRGGERRRTARRGLIAARTQDPARTSVRASRGIEGSRSRVPRRRPVRRETLA